MAKKIKTIIKINIPAGAATPAPPVGTALGPHGLPIMEFVKAFNDRTADQNSGHKARASDLSARKHQRPR